MEQSIGGGRMTKYGVCGHCGAVTPLDQKASYTDGGELEITYFGNCYRCTTYVEVVEVFKPSRE